MQPDGTCSTAPAWLPAAGWSPGPAGASRRALAPTRPQPAARAPSRKRRAARQRALIGRLGAPPPWQPAAW
eukprot:scaffold37634_cov48-Phaeocystis_antarctica.AAC.1